MTTFAELSYADRVAWLGGKYYGMMFLGLANAAYTSEGGKSSVEVRSDFLRAIEDTDYLPAMPELGQEGKHGTVEFPLSRVPGAWRLDWGPAIATDFSNLVYVASYRDPDGEPYFFVVGIRGTDTAKSELSKDAAGLINQLVQDLNAFTKHSWGEFLTKGIRTVAFDIDSPPNPAKTDAPPPGGNVAAGSMRGIDKIARLVPPVLGEAGAPGAGTPKAVAEALLDLVGEGRYPVIVTGHSLGGAQTQVMASYLQWQLGYGDDACTVIPQPFAPPTAGDAGFIEDGVFARGQFWVNSLDIVPYAYVSVIGDTGTVEADGDLLGVEWAKENLWTDETWPGTDDHCSKLPDAMIAFIDTATALGGAALIKKASYSRPWGRVVTMDGYVPDVSVIQGLLDGMGMKTTDPTGGVAQLMWQHFPPCYQDLLWKWHSADMVYFEYQSYHESAG